MIPGLRLVLLGKQGAGKGTQALKLSKHYHVPHISTGDMFRVAARSGSELGEEVRSYMNAGELVPDDLVIRVVEDRLTRPDTTRGFVLDGFPRTLPQAEKLQDVLEPLGGLDAMVNLVVPTEVVMERLGGRRVCRECGANYHVEAPPREGWRCDECGGEVVQRQDDTPEAIERRLALYESETRPLVEFYRERDLLVEVDGVGTPQEIFDRTVRALDTRRSRSRV